MTNYLLLKAALLTEGIRAAPEALKDVGVFYKEQNHGLFGWDFENHTNLKVPDDFLLEDGSVVQFRLNHKSPYIVRQTEEKLALFLNEEKLCNVSWIDRPLYYNFKSSRGNDMIRIGQVGGADNLFFCYQNYCSHFSKNQQCAFCNLVSTTKIYNSVEIKKDFKEIGEVPGQGPGSSGSACLIELAWEQGRLIRFCQVEQLIEFLKKAA